MGTQLSYTSGPGGYSANTSGTTGVPSAYGGNADVMNFFKILAQRRVAGQDAPQAATPAFAPVPQPSYALEDARLAHQAKVDASRSTGGPTEQEWRGAATRPVGLSPGMIPGMMVDPNLLPSALRPQAATMVGQRSRVPTGTVESPDMDAAAAGAQTTNVDPYERIRRIQLNQGYGR